MKKYQNLILLASNVIVGIGIVLVLALLLKNLNSSMADVNLAGVYNDIKWLLSIPIIAVVICCIGVSIFVYLIYQYNKKSEMPINPRLIKGLKNCGVASFINCILPLILTISSILIIDKTISIVLCSIALGISAIISIIVSGIVAYLNYSISFSLLSREELKRQADIANKDESYPESYERSSKVNDDGNDNNDSNIKQEASAGGF